MSVLDLYTIGVGPSSSHTVGPMRAARRFTEALDSRQLTDHVARITVALYGSLALTGKGHATDTAVIHGLSGERPRTIDPTRAMEALATIRQTGLLPLAGKRVLPFDEARDLLFLGDDLLPHHPNGMRFTALDGQGTPLLVRDYYSVGGGFVVQGEDEVDAVTNSHNIALPHPFSSGRELLALCAETGLSIAQIMARNETAWRPAGETDAFLDAVHGAMMDCITRALTAEGHLPGGLNVPRRAGALYRELVSKPEGGLKDPLTALDWINLYALAVNEENAAGGRVVTAPTNGAAGVIPAVLKYYETFVPSASPQGIRDFLLTAAAIGSLYKRRASISAADVGCQGEVGVACSMAAGALAAVMGGHPAQVENAAEIGMEHNLGLTCDPVAGLVQIPCIERNTMGAVKAVNAARLALRGDGNHLISLDRVIETMRQTGADMQSKYKETSLGGLAVNYVEC
ncbi:MAG: L-serine ammonia-lyase [Rhodospirillum sp.]|nr:L-serine ammonia-lyase [Rhodospirillum sp.]MCF8488525.1 L-serine ammonia-lyase [Rhodospirillum sp.]MCF8499270.1 L-serine ammonia-lyase [Rhodospirillum sp.]